MPGPVPGQPGSRAGLPPGCGPRRTPLWFCDFYVLILHFSPVGVEMLLKTQACLRPRARRQGMFESIFKSTYVCVRVCLNGFSFTSGEELVWIYGAFVGRLLLL